MLVQKGMHLCRPEFTRIWLFSLEWPEILTTSTPTKPHIPRNVPGSEFSGGYTGQLLLILFVRNVPFGLQRQVKFRVVLGTGYHLWSEPSFCEFMPGPVLIVDTSTQSTSSIFLGQSRTSVCFPSSFVPGPHFFCSCRPHQTAHPPTCAR